MQNTTLEDNVALAVGEFEKRPDYDQLMGHRFATLRLAGWRPKMMPEIVVGKPLASIGVGKLVEGWLPKGDPAGVSPREASDMLAANIYAAMLLDAFVGKFSRSDRRFGGECSPDAGMGVVMMNMGAGQGANVVMTTEAGVSYSVEALPSPDFDLRSGKLTLDCGMGVVDDIGADALVTLPDAIDDMLRRYFAMTD